MAQKNGLSNSKRWQKTVFDNKTKAVIYLIILLVLSTSVLCAHLSDFTRMHKNI